MSSDGIPRPFLPSLHGIYYSPSLASSFLELVLTNNFIASLRVKKLKRSTKEVKPGPISSQTIFLFFQLSRDWFYRLISCLKVAWFEIKRLISQLSEANPVTDP